jgi:glycosyltransferase involved in cell wall biosynthesis
MYNKYPQAVVSFHFHPGLESEIVSLCEELNAKLIVSKKYRRATACIERVKLSQIFKTKYCFHVYNTSVINIFLIVHKILFNSKIVYYFHEPTLKVSIDFDWGDNLKNIVVNLIHRIFFLSSDRLVVFSKCGQHKIPPKFRSKIVLRQLPFNFSKLISYRGRKIVTFAKLKILFYGNINSGKNPFSFIKLFEQLNDPRFELKILTTNYKLFKDYSRTCKGSIQFEYKSELEDETIIDEISQSDIILLPHARCTQSAILEKATFLGKPILFGSCSCFEEFINVLGVRSGSNTSTLNLGLDTLYMNYESFKLNCLTRHKHLL